MRAEYDFSKGERGKFYRLLDKGYKVYVHQSDGAIVSKSIPDPAEIIRRGREMRDVQLFMSIGEDRLRQIMAWIGIRCLKTNKSSLFINSYMKKKKNKSQPDFTLKNRR